MLNRSLLLGLFVYLFAQPAAWAAIQIQHPQVVDVTPSSFSIIWRASLVSNPSITIYQDESGTLDVTDQFEVLSYPIQGVVGTFASKYEANVAKNRVISAARDQGLVKLQVLGLNPNTQYYFRIQSATDTESISWPIQGTQSVTTPRETSFLMNASQLVVDLNNAAATGWLVSVANTSSPYGLSAFVEAGTGPGRVVLNLANFYGADGLSWNASQQEVFTLQILQGDGQLLSETITLNFNQDFNVASYVPHNLLGGFDGTIRLIAPLDNVYNPEATLQLAWVDSSSDVNATISIYFDNDNQGADGTLIASGLAAQPDGDADSYAIDVSTLMEGSYYFYAEISDGVDRFVSYSPAKVTLDRIQLDGDGDQISDLWEQHYFGQLTQGQATDYDADGITDALEYFYGEDPLLVNSQLGTLVKPLVKGRNIVGVPGALVPSMDSFELLTQLGNTAHSISRIHPKTKVLQVSYWQNGQPVGDRFNLLPGEGYILDMVETNELSWAPFRTRRPISVYEGMNIVAISGVNLQSTEFLSSLDKGFVSSIRRINPDTLLYETVAYDGDRVVGVPYAMAAQDGYILSVTRDGQIVAP